MNYNAECCVTLFDKVIIHIFSNLADIFETLA